MRRLALALLALSFAAATQAATISGTVTGESNQPLAAMTVAAYTAAGTLQTSKQTAAAGTYVLTLPAGTYRLVAYDPAGALATSFYADAESFETSAALTLTASQNQTNINFRLVRAGFAVGRVTGDRGIALPNITVAAYNLSGTRRGFTTTDANGGYTLALPPGSYRIAAYDETLQYATLFFDGVASFEVAADVTIATASSAIVNLQLPRATKVSGTVTDRTTHAPIANARVTAYASDGTIAARTVTGADGRYALAARPDALRIVVDDPAGGYATTYAPDAESFSMQPPIAAAAGASAIVDVTLVRAGRLSGRVTDRATGAPLAGLTAVAYNADGTTRAFATTNATGTFSVVVPPGDYRLGVFDAALVYVPQFHAGQSAFDGAAVVHANAEQTLSGFDFALTKGARISGRVTARSTGAAATAVTVAAYALDGTLVASTTTDAAGSYTLFVAPATVKVLAFDPSLRFATAYYLGAASFETTQPVAFFEGQLFTANFLLDVATHPPRRRAVSAVHG